MKALLVVIAATLGATLGAAAYAKERTEAAPYGVLRENVSILLTNSVNHDFGVGRDGSSLILREGRRWYRVTLLPPCAHNLDGEIRIGLIHRGPWFERSSQVLVGDYRCHVRRIDEIADPRPVDRAAKQ